MEKEEKIKKLYEEFDKFYEENEISPYNAAYAYFKAGFISGEKETKYRIKEYITKKYEEIKALSEKDFYDLSCSYGGAKYIKEIIDECFKEDD